MHQQLVRRRVRGRGKRILSLAISALYFSARGAWRTLAPVFGITPSRGSSVVLTYHGISAADVPKFRRQMQFLNTKAVTMFADEAADRRGQRCVAVTFDDALQSVFERALPILAQYRIPASIFVPTAYMGARPGWVLEDDPAGPLESVATADALMEADRGRIRIGSHTVSHPHLTEVDDAQLEAELVESRALLERITRSRVVMLSVPYGSYNPRVIEAATRAGYRLVFANVPVRTAPASPVVGRVDASPRDWWLEYCLKCHGAYEWMAVAVPLKRTLRAALSGRLIPLLSR